MARGRWELIGLCAAIVACVALVGGCPSPEPTTVSEPPMEATPVEVPEVAEQAAEETEEEATEEEATEAPTPVAGDFEYTDTPSVDSIPAGAISGMMHRQPFTAQTIRIEKKSEETFQMQISNGELNNPDKVTSTITDDDGWRFRFTVPEGSTTAVEWAIDDEKTFDEEHAYYYYQQEGDKPKMSVNGPWGAALEITEWTTQEPAEGSRVIGTVKGRVALVMRDADKSWAAGEFEAPVFEW